MIAWIYFADKTHTAKIVKDFCKGVGVNMVNGIPNIKLEDLDETTIMDKCESVAHPIVYNRKCHDLSKSYSNDLLLREIQISIIESELIQSIGRARLLRNDCTVVVLSNLPIQQAEFVYLPHYI